MKERLVVDLRCGRDGPASAWRYYLPAESEVPDGFHEPVSVSVKGGARNRGKPPSNADHCMKVHVGQNEGWLNADPLIDAFTALWPHLLQFVAALGEETVDLVYFAAQATHGELYGLWPYMPFGMEDDRRFFVSEACKDSRTRMTASGRLCVEYADEDFQRLAGPDGFEFFYGTTIMGISVAEAAVREYLKMPFLQKDVLAGALADRRVRCWWFCDADFEGMTVWHKDCPSDRLLKGLGDTLKVPAHGLGLVLQDDAGREKGPGCGP